MGNFVSNTIALTNHWLRGTNNSHGNNTRDVRVQWVVVFGLQTAQEFGQHYRSGRILEIARRYGANEFSLVLDLYSLGDDHHCLFRFVRIKNVLQD
jgi:hypothetical protein